MFDRKRVLVAGGAMANVMFALHRDVFAGDTG
jgi:hypothetical protein